MPRIRVTRCTACGQKFDGVSCVHGEEHPGGKRIFDLNEEMLPHPGAVTVCIVCGHIMAFDEDLQLRDLTKDEELQVAGNPALMIIQRARSSAIKAGKLKEEK